MNKILGNIDRHEGNYLINNETGHIHLIDHGISFAHHSDGDIAYANDVKHMPLHPKAAGWIKNINPDHIAKALKANNAHYREAQGVMDTLRQAQHNVWIGGDSTSNFGRFLGSIYHAGARNNPANVRDQTDHDRHNKDQDDRVKAAGWKGRRVLGGR